MEDTVINDLDSVSPKPVKKVAVIGANGFVWKNLVKVLCMGVFKREKDKVVKNSFSTNSSFTQANK